MKTASKANAIFVLAASAAILLSVNAQAALPKASESPFTAEEKAIAEVVGQINAEVKGANSKSKIDSLSKKLEDLQAKKKDKLNSLKDEFDKEIKKVNDKLKKSKGGSTKLENDLSDLEQRKADLDVWFDGKNPTKSADKPADDKKK